MSATTVTQSSQLSALANILTQSSAHYQRAVAAMPAFAYNAPTAAERAQIASTEAAKGNRLLGQASWYLQNNGLHDAFRAVTEQPYGPNLFANLTRRATANASSARTALDFTQPGDTEIYNLRDAGFSIEDATTDVDHLAMRTGQAAELARQSEQATKAEPPVEI